MKIFIAPLCMTVGVVTALSAPRIELRFDKAHLFAGEAPYITLVFRNDGDQTIVLPFARNRRRIRLRDESGCDYIRRSELDILGNGFLGPHAAELLLLQPGEWWGAQIRRSSLLPPSIGDHTFIATYESTGPTEVGRWEGRIASNPVRLGIMSTPQTPDDAVAYALLKDGRDAEYIVAASPNSVYAERLRVMLLDGCYPASGPKVTVRQRAKTIRSDYRLTSCRIVFSAR